MYGICRISGCSRRRIPLPLTEMRRISWIPGRSGNGTRSSNDCSMGSWRSSTQSRYRALVHQVYELTPQPLDVLEQALIVLWEMIQHQFDLFEDRETPLIEALFRLRSTASPVILESTNSLLSLLIATGEPLYLLSALQSVMKSVSRPLPVHQAVPNGSGSHDANGDAASGPGNEARKQNGEKARMSTQVFGLNGIGMCIMRLPKEVVEVEGPHLAPLLQEVSHSSELILADSQGPRIFIYHDSAIRAPPAPCHPDGHVRCDGRVGNVPESHERGEESRNVSNGEKRLVAVVPDKSRKRKRHCHRGDVGIDG